MSGGTYMKKVQAKFFYAERNDAKERADNMRERLRQKLIKKKQYKIKFDLYKNGMTTKIMI